MMMVSISSQIVKLRKQKDMSQQDLADKLNVTRQAVSNWERGKTEPDIEMLKSIASFFDVGIDFFVSGEIPEKVIDRSISKRLLIGSLLFVITHMVFAILGHVKLMGVMIAPGMILFIALIVYAMFGNSLKTGDYSIIAGYNKKKDDESKVKRQLLLIELLVIISAFILNGLYFLVYGVAASSMMFISMIMMLVFIVNIAVVVIVVNHKIKTR